MTDPLTDKTTDTSSDPQNDGSHSATHEPWKEPGQTSQDRSVKPPKNAVEQEKAKKDAQWEKGRM